MRLVINRRHSSWEDDSTGPRDETTEEAEVSRDDVKINTVHINYLQTIKHLWKPNLEIYGLEDIKTHKILGEMAGLRITKQKFIKYDTK